MWAFKFASNNWQHKFAVEYLDIGHGRGRNIILWFYSNGRLYQKLEENLKGFEVLHSDWDEFNTNIGVGSPTQGRVDLNKGIGSCILHTTNPRQQVRILDTLVDSFPGIRFQIFKDYQDPNRHPSPEPLQLFYEKVACKNCQREIKNYRLVLADGIWEDIEEKGPKDDKPISPYLPEEEYLTNLRRKDTFRTEYGWSVPTKKAIQKLKSFIGNEKVLEVGAGKGLWAKLMQDTGISITPTDLYAGQETPYLSGKSFTEVQQMDASDAINRFSDHTVLFLNWPPYDSPMADEALKTFRGNKVIYVGEGSSGCTGDDCFHNQLGREWKMVDAACIPEDPYSEDWKRQDTKINIPQWEGIHDCIHFYFCEDKTKAMPIPFEGTIPNIHEEDRTGAWSLGRDMPEELAETEEKRSPQMTWLGHGNRGVAYDLGNDTVLKYTSEISEIYAAKRLMENPIPCTVDVYSVEQLPTSDIYALVLEKVQPMKEETASTYFEDIPEVSELIDCLKEHGYQTNDVNWKNVGWNKEGRLVLLDVGHSISQEEARKEQSSTKAKPMPLPYRSTIKYLEPPIGNEWLHKYHGSGAFDIDKIMSEEAAEKEEKKRPSMTWLGHGNMGIAYQDKGKVIKYTDESSEAKAAERLMRSPIPCTVSVYDVELVEDRLWSLVLEKVKPITWKEYSEAMESGLVEELNDCLIEHGYFIDDVHWKNLGWNQDGDLVLLDLGGTLSTG
ncbi:hypothetical protein LCGC14_0629790 [marine sediment metagenome]|uniref:Uncharacterized protein n=1 Tax=marine sediment metagenome TaxID=412755 RepID=A0A0F9UAQ4_9ZZZZ